MFTLFQKKANFAIEGATDHTRRPLVYFAGCCRLLSTGECHDDPLILKTRVITDLIVQGAQNLVVPIRSSMSNISRRKLHQKPQIGLTTMHKGCEYCWLTQEDVVRYLLSSIGLFSPSPPSRSAPSGSSTPTY